MNTISISQLLANVKAGNTEFSALPSELQTIIVQAGVEKALRLEKTIEKRLTRAQRDAQKAAKLRADAAQKLKIAEQLESGTYKRGKTPRPTGSSNKTTTPASVPTVCPRCGSPVRSGMCANTYCDFVFAVPTTTPAPTTPATNEVDFAKSANWPRTYGDLRQATLTAHDRGRQHYDTSRNTGTFVMVAFRGLENCASYKDRRMFELYTDHVPATFYGGNFEDGHVIGNPQRKIWVAMYRMENPGQAQKFADTLKAKFSKSASVLQTKIVTVK